MRVHPSPNLQQLAEAIHAIERPWSPADQPGSRNSPFLPTGWPAADHALGGGLPLRTIHEWFAPADAPPLMIFAHLAQQSNFSSSEHSPPNQNLIWIGRRCWPYGAILGEDLLERSLFIDPPDDASRLWAIDLALRCPAVTVVVADGSEFHMPQTRRLQLAAETSHALALIARPDREMKTLSAAGTRWLIKPMRTTSRGPRWTAQLLRCKGMQPTSHALKWALEVDDATNRIRASGEMVD